MSDRGQHTDRRKVLKKIGTTTATAGLGLSGVSPVAAAEAIETEKLPNSDEVVSEAVDTRQFREVRSSLEQMGFKTDTDAGVAKETSAPEKVGYEYGVVFPLRQVFTTNIWGSEVNQRQLNVDGHLLWSRQVDGSVTATGVLFGTSADSASKVSLRQVLQSPDNGELGGLVFVRPSETTTDVVDGSRSLSDDPVGADESIKQCMLDNTGIIGGSDEIITCTACLSPTSYGPLSILSCLYCGHSLHVQHCLLTYCEEKTGASNGDYCDQVQSLTGTPLDLLPGSFNSTLMMTLRSQAAGCEADEGNDCTSPLVE